MNIKIDTNTTINNIFSCYSLKESLRNAHHKQLPKIIKPAKLATELDEICYSLTNQVFDY
jgi:hypothetical protein